ncbi:hypothetical protein [Nocardia gamkensis]|uniref:hypothetical protein n=1 Tax=Nocardia gamkensis TaxID=352869 RepID=UPI0037CAEE68
MRYFEAVSKAKIGIRGRILSIALVTSLALVVTGAIVAGLLLVRGCCDRSHTGVAGCPRIWPP